MGSTPSSTAGSSPRVRGKRVARLELATVDRLIPACAGKTGRPSRCGSGTAAHPRVCGENFRRPRSSSWPPGSSPRVRGKPSSSPASWPVSWLIPACAGKTRRRGGRPPGRSAHPRVCGENARKHFQRLLYFGSSPRVRGKPRRRNREPEHRGLIPACAGKTTTPTRWPWRTAAHPRVCGENGEEDVGGDAAVGSSPRVRGKRDRV